MNNSRLLSISEKPFDGESVAYVMHRDQRVQDNHALLTAQDTAIEHNVPLYVLFIMGHIETRSREHYQFMLNGLEEVSKNLKKKNIAFVLKNGPGVETITQFVNEVSAGAVYFDFSPLNELRDRIKAVAAAIEIPVSVIDTHNIVPVWALSDKQEFAAHTVRRKIHKNLDTYLVSPAKLKKHPIEPSHVESLSFSDAHKIIQSYTPSGIKISYTPGESAAHAQLQTFFERDLKQYGYARNNISVDGQSGLSPYLHFGHISSLRIAIEISAYVNEPPLLLQSFKLVQSGDTPSAIDGMNVLLEEMIVRKELADNYCFYNKDYTSIKGAPAWAQKTLATHAHDPRDFEYSQDQWERCETHDEIWNAAQLELNKTGKMHGYLRMYWAKKLLEWSKSPEEAIAIGNYLNDKFSTDGGDPNGYVGILWSIAGLHDRPWFERPVYGVVRYMNAGGLRRKFDVDAYIQRVNDM
jgi:deoxyribodipyrimidine photo-lyase